MDINKELIEYCKENDFPINDMDINDFKKVEKTLEGDMMASVGDFIIKGLIGEFYPCKPDVFHKKYEEV